MADAIAWGVERAAHELALFAAIGVVIGGIDDLIVDLIWIVRSPWARLTSRNGGAQVVGTAGARRPIAVFVPTWGEAEVIGPMLETALAQWRDDPFRIYVAVYPNDPDTSDAVTRIADPRIRCVVNPQDGPTTKADNLNVLWRALRADDPDGAVQAILLHDAEDVVHSAELRVFDALIDRYDLIQLPVLPLIERGSGFWARAISSVYADEFAEAHGRQMAVREAVGASLPAAGVGCAFRRDRLERLAGPHEAPFDPTSVTEDYEIGLRIGDAGGRTHFARFVVQPSGLPVAVRAHFPDSWSASVRQKARWQAGIALAGWDRLGWAGGLAERWMRLRDRRAILAALVLAIGYAAALLWLLLGLAGVTVRIEPWMITLLAVATMALAWRMAVRVWVTARFYGWREGLGAMPRMLLANLIAIAAARAALCRFLAERRRGRPVWDKTDHRFPQVQPAE
jgi:bacteriophage N4 adsorption protein B